MVACISFVGVFVSSFVCPVCVCLFLYCVLSVLSLYWVRLFLLSGSVSLCVGFLYWVGSLCFSCVGAWVVSLVLGVLCLVGGFFFLVSVLFLYWVRLFLYMVVVGSVAGVCVCWLSLWWV